LSAGFSAFNPFQPNYIGGYKGSKATILCVVFKCWSASFTCIKEGQAKGLFSPGSM
jgi:hypothetical protein